VPHEAGVALLLRRGQREVPPIPGRQLHEEQEHVRLGGILPQVVRGGGTPGRGVKSVVLTETIIRSDTFIHS
jgi:hypothetical protein